MGLALLANLSTYDFGYLSAGELIGRTERALATMQGRGGGTTAAPIPCPTREATSNSGSCARPPASDAPGQRPCSRVPHKTAIIDSSCERRITYSEYGELIENIALGLVAAGVKPGEVIAVYLPNCWEFCAVYHAATLAGAIPTLLNPSYREREVRYQLENSGAAVLISDGVLLQGINLGGLTKLRRVYTTRQPSPGAEPFANLLRPVTVALPTLDKSSDQRSRRFRTPAEPPAFPRE